MSQIKIDIDDNRGLYLLSGDVQSILKNPIIKYYFKDYLKADFSTPNLILVPFVGETKELRLKKLQEVLSRYGLSETRSERIEESLRSYLQEQKNFENFSQRAKEIRDNHCDKDEFKQFADVINKTLVGRTLYPLQLLSAYHLAFSQNACNFSVPGSGKTSIVYAAFSFMKNLPPDNPKHVDILLIIGPLSSFGPWENEYYSCFSHHPKSQRLHSKIAKNERTKYLYSSNPAEITLVSYQGVPSMLDDLVAFLRRNKVMVVLDEAHKIKNIEGGIIAQSALALARYGKSRVVLTGTPLPNGYEDLKNIYTFIWPTKDIIPFYVYQLRQMSSHTGDKRIASLIDHISPFFIRIRKKDLGLPEPINNPPLLVKMSHIQKQIYDYIEKKYMGYFLKSSARSFKEEVSKARIVRLMQCATNPNLLRKPLEEYYERQGIESGLHIDDSEIMSMISNYPSSEVPSKFLKAENIIREKLSKGEKVIVWTTFIQTIHDFQDFLSSKGIQSKIIYGATPIEVNDDLPSNETREAIIRDFHNQDSGFKVLIANPFSISESISLHQACHNAIYLDRNFNAGQFIQSKDRIHRYGLKNTDVINYYYILSEDSIDESIHRRLIFKEQRMNNIIETAPIPLFFNVDQEDLGDDDIKAIIDDYLKRRA